MSQVGGVKDIFTLCDGYGREAMVNHGGGEQAEPGMTMLLVVPGEEVLTKSTSILDGPKAFGEARPVFQGFEVALRIGVVVGDMGAAMGFGNPEIRHE